MKLLNGVASVAVLGLVSGITLAGQVPSVTQFNPFDVTPTKPAATKETKATPVSTAKPLVSPLVTPASIPGHVTPTPPVSSHPASPTKPTAPAPRA